MRVSRLSWQTFEKTYFWNQISRSTMSSNSIFQGRWVLINYNSFHLDSKTLQLCKLDEIERVNKAGVKLTNIVGPTMWADKSWTIWHPISTMWERVWSTWPHKICILVSVKHFSPTNVSIMTLTETDLWQTSNSSRSWTQEAVNMAVPCWKLLWGWYVSGFKLMEDQEWATINVKSTRDV